MRISSTSGFIAFFLLFISFPSINLTLELHSSPSPSPPPSSSSSSCSTTTVTGIPIFYRVFNKSSNFGCTPVPRIGGGIGGIGRNILRDRLDKLGRPILNDLLPIGDSDRHCLPKGKNFNWFSSKPDVQYINVTEGQFQSINFYPGHSFDISRGFVYFTAEIHLCFVYKDDGDESLTITSDSDLWLYLNRRLLIDLGGIHSTTSITTTLDGLGLKVGKIYRLDIFFAQRYRLGTNVSFRFNLCTGCCCGKQHENTPAITPNRAGDDDDDNADDGETDQITSKCGNINNTHSPTKSPTKKPSPPTKQPTLSPTTPTKSPTSSPTILPTKVPSLSPTSIPTIKPTTLPPIITQQPTSSTKQPTLTPTLIPTNQPTTFQPTNQPTLTPTNKPTPTPTSPTNQPTSTPTLSTNQPTSTPTLPTNQPTSTPTIPTNQPTYSPTLATNQPTSSPTLPTNQPTATPTTQTTQPTIPTNQPTSSPTSVPTSQPTPSLAPTTNPTTTAPLSPTNQPTKSPTTGQPTSTPTKQPTAAPTKAPTSTPTCAPTVVPLPPHPCCGNGIIEPGEQCDNGAANNDIFGNCTHHCRFPICGDGIIHRCNSSSNCTSCEACDNTEECDDGNNINGDGCDANCRFECNPLMNSVALTTVEYRTTNLINHLPDCPRLSCVTPPRKDLENHMHDMDFTLLYWIKNYCFCSDV